MPDLTPVFSLPSEKWIWSWSILCMYLPRSSVTSLCGIIASVVKRRGAIQAVQDSGKSFSQHMGLLRSFAASAH